jgi:chromosome segregation ATPase
MDKTRKQVLARHEGVFEDMKKARVNKLVYENLLDLVDEIDTQFQGKVDLKIIKDGLLDNLVHAKETLKKSITRYKIISGGVVPQIEDHRRIRSREAGHDKKDFDTDDESYADDSSSDQSESEEEDREPTRNTQGVSPAITKILQKSLHDAGKNQQNAQEFIANIEETSQIIHDLRQQMAEAAAERTEFAHEAAETDRESAQFEEKMHENQQHIDALNRKLSREREMRATFEGKVQSLEEKSREIITEMAKMQQEHYTKLNKIQEGMAEEVERQVRETLTTLQKEIEDEGNDVGNDGGNEDGGSASGSGSDDGREPNQTNAESLFQQAEDLKITAEATAEDAAGAAHEIAEIRTDIDQTNVRIQALRNEADQHPEDAQIARELQKNTEKKEGFIEELKEAKQKLDENQAAMRDIKHDVQAISKQAAELSLTTEPDDPADERTLKETQDMTHKALQIIARVENIPDTFPARGSKGQNPARGQQKAFGKRTTFQ